MLNFREISLRRSYKELFTAATAQIFSGDKIGVIGKNGCGKSSLFRVILGDLMVDSGECLLQNHKLISSLEQEFPEQHQTAIDYVLAGDSQYVYWTEQLEIAQYEHDDRLFYQASEQLQHLDAYAKPALAATILSGLGFQAQQFALDIQTFSGGWQMRLNLARCLMCPADLYLLDEPSNHLDLPALLWLETWIQQLSATVLIISHDREFLDQTVDKILHIDQKKFKMYSGNYSQFERIRAEQLQQQQHLYQQQQAQLQHMLNFVQRFKAKASKAKQAQSRLKAMKRIELLAQAHVDSDFDLRFFPVEILNCVLLKCHELVIGYQKTAPLISQSFFEVWPQDRIGILGANGQGKSTFIRTLMGELPAISGQILRHPKLVYGYFAQNQFEQFDLDLTPFEIIQQSHLQAKEAEIRSFLGQYHFHADMITTPIRHFSGGEKARLNLAKLVWQKPDLLILDEPTNHLDLELRAALVLALQTFMGAVILISHDRHLLRTTVNDFYMIHGGEFKRFDGDLDDYYHFLQQHGVINKKNVACNPEIKTYKDQKVLQGKMKRLEGLMEDLKKKLQDVVNRLGQTQLYDVEHQVELQQLYQLQKKLQLELTECEEQYLDLLKLS